MSEKPLDCPYTAIQPTNDRCTKCEYRLQCIEQLDLEFKKAVIKSGRIIKTEKAGRIVIDPNDIDKINNFAELVSKLKAALESKDITVDYDSEAFISYLHEYLDSHEMF